MQKKYIIGFIVIVIIAGVVVAYFLLTKEEPTTLTNTQTNGQPVINATIPLTNTGTSNTNAPVDDTEKTKLELARIATTFAERFGSYSNQSEFENIESLKVFMSRTMSEWADRFIEAGKTQDTSTYYGVTTKVITPKLVKFEANSAEFLMTTQRTEATETTANEKVFYQDIAIKFIKEAGDWKVNEARWQEINPAPLSGVLRKGAG